MARRNIVAIFGALALSAGVSGAFAADAGNLDGVFSAERWGVGVGGFAGFQPAYEGSDEYRFVGYPLILPKYYGDSYDPTARSRVDFKGLDDVRVTAVRLGGLDLGPVVGYNFGRDESLAARLGGLGDIDGGVNVGAFAGYHFDPFYVDVAYVDQVTGATASGPTLRFGAGVQQEVSDRMALSAYVSGSYASEDYIDTYFSVTPAQAAASTAGLAAFDAGKGFKDVGIDIGVDYRMTDRMTLTTRAGYSRLLNDAAASPVTASRHQFSGGLGVTYTFGRTD